MNNRDKILLGVCVSTLTADRCDFCIDTCEAFKNFCKVQEELNRNGIKRSIKQ